MPVRTLKIAAATVGATVGAMSALNPLACIGAAVAYALKLDKLRAENPEMFDPARAAEVMNLLEKDLLEELQHVM